VKCIAVISCFFLGQLSVSFLGPCCLAAPLYCIAVYDCLMLTERINDDDDENMIISRLDATILSLQ